MTDLPRPKILVVDDTPANLLVMRKLLSKVDADLVEAGNGIDALSACLDHEFALILLDVNMPEMDGFEVATLLYEEGSTRQTPIIFVTAGYGDDLNRLKGYDSGAVDYIAKPINDRILLSKVRIFLELYGSKRQLKATLEELFDRNRLLQREITERQHIEALVRHQAHHDALTGLPNRVLFLDRIDTAIERAGRHDSHCALLYIDIDGFKPVNDEHGHAVGDVLLQQIAQRLLENVRRSDTVARLGGDEFAVILEEISDGDEALRMGRVLCEALGTPFSLGRADEAIEVRVGGSIGAALYPLHGRERESLITAADAAMYRAKRSGRSQCLLALASP